MRNVWLVIKNEIRTMLGRRSFWIMTFLFPAFIILLNVGTQVMANDAFEANQESFQDFLPTIGEPDAPAEEAEGEAGEEAETAAPVTPQLPVSGYVDEAGLVTAVPPFLSARLQAYPDEDAAHAAVTEGVIDDYYVIPPDFMETGALLLVEEEFRPFTVNGGNMINFLLNYNLTREETLAATILRPTSIVEQYRVAPQGGGRQQQTGFLAFIVPFATMFIFFFLLTISSGFMLQSVSREKENRTVEILLLSLRPRELMLGKVLGLSTIGLIQMLVWLGGSMLVLDRGGEVLQFASEFTLPPGFLAWALLFFLLGYILYASLMGAVGALAPNAREGGQFTFIVIFPLLVPIWLNGVFLNDPNGILATALSLFPLTAPTSMMTRLAAGGVPFWQPVASLVGLGLTTYLFVLLAARFFRADTLLSSSQIRWGRIWQELRRG